MFAEQRADCLGRCLAEQRERLTLRGDNGEGHVVGGVLEAPRREQRELVEGQRPGRGVRERERDRVNVSTLGLDEQPAECVTVGRASEGECAGDCRSRQDTAGDHQRVVGDLRTATGAGNARVVVDRGELSQREGRVRGLGDSGELEMPRLSGVERLGDRKRLVPKRGLGREQLDVDKVAGQLAQREHRLEPRDAAAGDQNTETAIGPR